MRGGSRSIRPTRTASGGRVIRRAISATSRCSTSKAARKQVDGRQAPAVHFAFSVVGVGDVDRRAQSLYCAIPNVERRNALRLFLLSQNVAGAYGEESI